MTFPLAGLRVTPPAGQTVTVNITAPGGQTASAYNDNGAVNSVVLPSIISTTSTYYLTSNGPWIVSVKYFGTELAGQTFVLEDAEVATVNLASITNLAAVGASPLPTYGFVPSSLIGWRRGLNNMLNGTRPAKILCLGDSQTRGYGQGNDSVGWPGDLAPTLSGRGFSTAKGLVCPEFTRLSQTADPRIAYGAGWSVTHSNHVWWGGVGPYWTAPSGTNTNLTFTPGTLCNAFDVYYWSVAGLGGMTVTGTGGSGSVVNTATTPGTGIGKVTVHAATNATTNAVTIGTITTAVVAIIGVEAYQDPAGPGTPAPQVLVGNAGVNGSLAFGWNDNTNPTYGPKAAVQAYAPDLTFIMLGPNDANASQTVVQFTASIQAIITYCTAAGGSAVLVTSVPGSPANSYSALLQSYQPALLNLAYANGCGLIDIYNRLGGLNGYNTLNPLGWYFDTIHPDQVGYFDVSTTVSTALMTL